MRIVPAAGTRRRLLGFVVALAVAGPILASCGMFSIRKPVEPGTGGQACARRNPIDPDSVLYNFSKAMGCGSDGIPQFDETLGPGFQLALDALDVQNRQGARDTLTAEEVKLGQQGLVNSTTDSLYFVFSRVEPTRTSGTAFYERMPYTLQFIERQADTTIVTRTISGEVNLTATELSAGSWVLSLWGDLRDGSDNQTLGSFYDQTAPAR